VLLGFAAPTIVSVFPQLGPTIGGSVLSISGLNWGNFADPGIFVGGIVCPLIPGSYSPSPGNTVTAQCILPAGQGIGLHTSVVIGGQVSPPLAFDLYQYAPPTITKVTPASGPTSGRQAPAMVVNPVSGAVSFVPGDQIVMTVSSECCGKKQ
jgi:hypothetical protein